MDKLEVSVVIPVYNAAPYVRQAVESALAQPQVWEVLLVEDGSPDNALEVCRELAGISRSRSCAIRNGEAAARAPAATLGCSPPAARFWLSWTRTITTCPGVSQSTSAFSRKTRRCEGVYHAVEMHVKTPRA